MKVRHALVFACALGCGEEPARTPPIALKPAPEAAPQPAALPAAAPASVPEPPKQTAPASDAPVSTLRGEGKTRASASRGKVIVDFHVDDPCFDSSPKVAIDLAAHTLRITHALRDPNMRCIPEPTDYRTTISGLPAGRFELSAPGLPAAFIDVPEPAQTIEPRARSVAKRKPKAHDSFMDF